jgi:hypothetical protein
MTKKKKRVKIPAKQGICKSSKKKSTKKKAAKKTKPKKNIQKDAESKVGYKNPPKNHQFPPGQSGNPGGPPTHRIHLWSWFCKFMLMGEPMPRK